MEDFSVIDAISQMDMFISNINIPEEERKRIIKSYDIITKKLMSFEEVLTKIAYHDGTELKLGDAVELAINVLQRVDDSVFDT